MGQMPKPAVFPPQGPWQVSGKPPINQVFEAGAIVRKPTIVEEAKWLLERSLQLRLTTRVLVVDGAASIRRLIVKEHAVGDPACL